MVRLTEYQRLQAKNHTNSQRVLCNPITGQPLEVKRKQTDGHGTSQDQRDCQYGDI